MSELFENIELQMQEDGREKNPRSAVLASQMETEKRFGKFIDENPNRVGIIDKEIKNVTDKYAFKYEVDPEMVYRETISHLTKGAIAIEAPSEVEEEFQVVAGLRESLNVMRENGFDKLAEKWESRLQTMSAEDQMDLYPDVVDSFLEAVQASPQTEMWDLDPNQYEEWDKTSSHEEMSDEELLEKIKDAVAELKQIDEPLSDELEELHQELWDRSGLGDKWRNRTKEETLKPAEEVTDEMVPEMGSENYGGDEVVNDPSPRMAARDAAIARFIGLEQANVLNKEAVALGMDKEAILGLTGPDVGVQRGIPGSGGIGQRPNDDFLHMQDAPAKRHPLRPDTWGGNATVPFATWQNYIQRSNSYGQNPVPEMTPSQAEKYKKDMGYSKMFGLEPPRDPRLQQTKGDPKLKTQKGKPTTWDQVERRSPFNWDFWLKGPDTRYSKLEQELIEYYMDKGLDQKHASIIVESIGEMAQLQQNEPGLETAWSDPDSPLRENIDPTQGIGGPEGDKYRNWNVEEKQQEVVEDNPRAYHQDFTEFEEIREFIQPGGEAPYSSNDERTIEEKDKYVTDNSAHRYDRTDMSMDGVKQEDNPPDSEYMKSSATRDWQDDYEERYRELVDEGYDEDQAKDLAEQYANYMEEKLQGYDDYYRDHQSPQEVYDEMNLSPLEDRDPMFRER